jgi:hypothetical protein
MTLQRRQLTTTWTFYQPVFSTANNNGSLGDGTLKGMWRRNGDSLQFSIYMMIGSTTTTGTGDFRFTTPPQFSYDGSKYPLGSPGGIPAFGMSYLLDSSTPANNTSAVYNMGAGVSLPFTIRLVIDGNAQVNSTTPFTWATNDEIHISGTAAVVEFC